MTEEAGEATAAIRRPHPRGRADPGDRAFGGFEATFRQIDERQAIPERVDHNGNPTDGDVGW